MLCHQREQVMLCLSCLLKKALGLAAAQWGACQQLLLLLLLVVVLLLLLLVVVLLLQEASQSLQAGKGCCWQHHAL
jgi:hypothetical protein